VAESGLSLEGPPAHWGAAQWAQLQKLRDEATVRLAHVTLQKHALTRRAGAGAGQRELELLLAAGGGRGGGVDAPMRKPEAELAALEAVAEEMRQLKQVIEPLLAAQPSKEPPPD
jgi:hypothetical protein